MSMLRPSHAARRAATLLTLVAAACGGGGTEPPAPSSIAAVTPNPLASATVGTVIGSTPTFEVRSSKGKALSGIPVSVAVSAGGGGLTGAPTVSLAGPTPIGQWTLGTTSGTQSVTVTVDGVAPLVFTVPSVAGAATQLAIVDGDDQFGTQNQPVAAPLRVRARDTHNNPVVGATIAWAVDAGGGNLAAATSVTGADGIALSPSWTLGTIAAGEQAVVASLGGLSQRFTATAQTAPAAITVETAAPGSATVGSVLNPAPSFAVRDGNGVALQGVPVTVVLTAGGGQLAGAPTHSALGATPIGTWTLGTTVSTQTVTVTVAGLPVQTYTLSATAGAPAQLSIVQGAGQTALAGAAVAVNPRVKLADQFGNGLSGQTVLWNVQEGGGLLGGSATVNTTAGGFAEVPGWTLGRRGGSQMLTATSNGFSQSFFASIQTSFTVDLRFVGSEPTGPVLAAFTSAARRIEAMITGDITDAQIGSVTSPFNITSCNAALTGVQPLNEVVDDVIIYAAVVPIDGVGQVLGSAGPCLTRTLGGLTGLGTMRFDSADLDNLAANGRLGDVILHEMLHVVGIGTLWGSRGLLADASLPTARVTGPLATSACVNDHGGGGVCPGYVPAENCLDLNPGTNCGVGTRDSHWKESVFRTELMTGYAGATNTLSKMTVQGLADLGYVVNTLAADPYTVPTPLMAFRTDEAAVEARHLPEIELAEPLRPRFTVDRNGRIRPILR